MIDERGICVTKLRKLLYLLHHHVHYVRVHREAVEIGMERNREKLTKMKIWDLF